MGRVGNNEYDIRVGKTRASTKCLHINVLKEWLRLYLQWWKSCWTEYSSMEM